MKKAIIFIGILVILAAPALAGVVKKTKSDITFRGFGKFGLAQSEKLTGELKWTDSKSDFKGQGIAGSLAGKTILRSGDTGEIIDLPASTMTQLDNKKKEYTVSPIKKLAKEAAGQEKEAREEPEEAAESNIKITRSEFKVEDTGEESTLNNFPVRKYLVDWLTEWENTETGEKGSSRLESLVWTTPITETLRKAQEEELTFSKAYLDKIGIDVGKMEQDVLGIRWLSILDAFGKGKGQPPRDFSKTEAELNKIKGYPIVVDGKYFVTGQKPQAGASEEAEEETPTDVKKALGGLLKKTLKKKPADAEAAANEPALTFRTEVLEISTPDLGAGDFQVPAGYKKKG